MHNEIDQNTNFAKLPNANWQVVYNYICTYSAFGCSYFCVSFFHEKKSERIERRSKAQNPIISESSESESEDEIEDLEDLKTNLEPTKEVTEPDFAATALNPGNEIKMITG